MIKLLEKAMNRFRQSKKTDNSIVISRISHDDNTSLSHSDNLKIPKIIHYCWFGGKPLPRSARKCISSWKKYCPDYIIVRWDESNFDVHINKFVEDAYKSRSWAFISDYARLKIIYDYGGFYLDTDVELYKSLDELRNNECYMGIQQNGNLIATGLGFGAIPRHRFIRRIMNYYDEKIVFNDDDLLSISCPEVMEKIFLGRKDIIVKPTFYSEYNVTIYPSEYFDPLAPGDTKNLLSAKTVSIHHYDATWTSRRNRIKRKMVRLLGQSNAYRIKNIKKRMVR